MEDKHQEALSGLKVGPLKAMPIASKRLVRSKPTKIKARPYGRALLYYFLKTVGINTLPIFLFGLGYRHL